MPTVQQLLQDENKAAFRGDTFAVKLAFKAYDQDTRQVLGPIDITGWTFWLTLKLKEEDTDAQAVFQEVYENTVDPETGIIVPTIEPSDTVDFLGVYYYDIQYKRDSGYIKTLCKGTVEFVADITITQTP